MDIFEFNEMIFTLKTLFAKNKYEYQNIEDHVSHYFYKRLENGINGDLENKFKEHLKKQNEENKENPEETNLESVEVRVTKKEQSFIKEREDDYLSSILEENKLGYLKPIMDLDIDKLREYLIKENTDTEKIENDIKKVMLENIRKENKKEINENCLLVAKKIKSLAKKMKEELKKNEKEEERIEREMRKIEKNFSKDHREEFTGGKDAVILTEDILDKNINKFNEAELNYVAEYIRINANKFKTVASRTMQKDKKKVIDFKKTMKESVSTFGFPIELYYQKPKKKKTKIVCIMDISGSVKKHSKLLSQFIYEISSVFMGGVKSYAFIRDLKEVTPYMSEYELSEGYERAMAVVPRAYSDYNYAFKVFSGNYVKTLDRNTIVIILGDARNNKNDSGVQYLKEIKENSKAVIWLNPDERKKWNQGDSIIGKYQPHIDSLNIASTPNELIDFLTNFAI